LLVGRLTRLAGQVPKYSYLTAVGQIRPWRNGGTAEPEINRRDIWRAYAREIVLWWAMLVRRMDDRLGMMQDTYHVHSRLNRMSGERHFVSYFCKYSTFEHSKAVNDDQEPKVITTDLGVSK